jgi:type II secretory pathway component PulF
MNHEQLSFFNQQLAAMLKSGLPLESSLKQLSASMSRGALRDEVQKLEADLEQGVPLDEALGRRRLPELYVAMLRAGLKGNDLPGVLTLAADYYGQLHATWLRLKGLMVYPGIVLVTSLFVAAFVAVIYSLMAKETSTAFGAFGPGQGPSASLPWLLVQVWLPVAFLAFTTLAFVLVLSVRRWRQRARWFLPGFREASLSQLAATLATMLEQGTSLDVALEVVQRNEGHVGARSEIARWRERLGGGAKRFSDLVQHGRLVPPLFVWLVMGAGENWARGFRRAAEIYDARAKYRVEVVLYAALPVTILLVGGIVALEMVPLFRSFAMLLNDLGGMSDIGG